MTGPAPRAAGNRVLAVLLLVLALAVASCVRGGSDSGDEPATTTTATGPTAREAAPQPGAGGIPACDPGALPPEAEEVVADIEAGGPYDYPRNDGVRFQNREGLLPPEDPGYYREFTVETPGVEHRGARRILTGGEVEQDPERWYYTDDHYESFCAFAP